MDQVKGGKHQKCQFDLIVFSEFLRVAAGRDLSCLRVPKGIGCPHLGTWMMHKVYEMPGQAPLLINLIIHILV